MNEEEEYDEIPLYRTNGYWYIYAFDLLYRFVNKLKVEKVIGIRDIPLDLQDKIYSCSIHDISLYRKMQDKIKLLHEYDVFIKNELKERLKTLNVDYDERDHYKNAINYAKIKELDLSNDGVLHTQVCPWLGLTDWHSSSGGNALQKVHLQNVLKRT